MGKEFGTGKTPNETLLENLPEIAGGLDELWACYANRTIGFAGGGNLRGEKQPDEMGTLWSSKINGLISGCEVNIHAGGEINDKEWGEMITSLSDLADELGFYFSPLWHGVTDEERSRTLIRMDVNAQKLLQTFRKRGYLKSNQSFKIKRDY